MTTSAVAARYANALADVVTAPGSGVRAEDLLAELRSFEGAFRGSDALQNALMSPAVPPARKRAVVEKIAASLKLSRVARNFLYVLIDHRRIASLEGVLHSFEIIVDERLGFARAELTSARELTEAQRGALSAQMEKLTGKRIRMRFAVDAALIGGAVARIGSTVYDGSVRGQLDMLGRKLATEN
ncbi:MAG TPA: ATP synthase F1 subunit delta [Candidatus Solibacter sp.]|nr:ATP synthase F1 subunit delta [Candidatus Solibacter sp.]